MGKSRRDRPRWTRRSFLQTVGASAPTLSLVLDRQASGEPLRAPGPPGKSSPIDLGRFFNASPRDLGPREQARWLGGESADDGLLRLPAGEQALRGLPFRLGPDGLGDKRFVLLSTQPGPPATRTVEVPLGRHARFVCLAAFCEWDEGEAPVRTADRGGERVGETLADAVLVHDDGTETRLPLRRRFEVHSPTYSWGRMAFAARPHRLDGPRGLADPLARGTDWGELQTVVADSGYTFAGTGTLWVSALANPRPDRPLRALRLEARSEDAVALCGLTLFHGRENPLRLERLRLYRLTLPLPGVEPGRWKVEVDLGIVGRTILPAEFDPEAWLAAPDAGLGERAKPLPEGRELYVEVTASPEATLVVAETGGDQRFEFDLGRVEPGRPLEARVGSARVELVERGRVFLHGRVLDAATRRPTPVRLAFRSREGRYIPPYGHRAEVNTGWFQDYGADVAVGDAAFAYVDGTFQVELPVGEVYVEVGKGFEYAPVRRRLKIEPTQRELVLEASRFANLRAKGWVTADTHVHFLSPSTAVLEGQAEGLNLVSLLAAQWGDLFTNVGDLPHGPLVSRDGETTVQVSTENRQHLLGHLGLVGGHGAPVFPMSASGPGESYLGDPLWTSLADWADSQRARAGLVVAVHFPYPNAELAADVALEKIDAVELFPYGAGFDTQRFRDWYRYLDAGYRLPAVGGTDKMGAYMPVGANRTYAHIGGEAFSFEGWARAVRAGRTFMTTGPLLLLEVDGRTPGDEILLGRGGGRVEVRLEARGFVPFHRVEVVWNGQVVASREDAAGTRETTLRETVAVPGPGWLAARCSSRLGPTTAWGLAVQAHTSPVYFRVPGRDLFSASAVGYMLTLVDGAETWTRTLATPSDPERMERVLSLFRAARERLHRRLHDHGVAH
jgi:hypothetical protein